MKITALFFRGMAIGFLSATALAGCQKDAAVNEDLVNASKATPALIVGLPSIFIEWGQLKDSIPYAPGAPADGLPICVYAQGFTINGKGFVCGGQLNDDFSGRNIFGYFVTDLWQYDAGSMGWIKRSPFPGGGDHSQVELAINFVIGDNAYIIGTDNQTYKYNQPTDTWSMAAPFPGVSRTGPCGFAVNGLGYVGMGANTTGVTLSDWWQYDPVGDKWYGMDAFPGNSRTLAACFTVDGKGYLVGGWHSTATAGAHGSTVWQYTPGGLAVNGSWQQKKNFPGGARYNSNGTAGTIAGVDVGFLVGGIESGIYDVGDVWTYNPPVDSWTKEPKRPGGGIGNSAVFVVGKTLFVANGPVAVMGWSR